MTGPYYEDVELGEVTEFDDHYEVTQEEIIEFGTKYEPWIQHVDPTTANESAYVRQLTAGTFHICAMGLRCLYDALLEGSGAVDTVAVRDARRKLQVHPGDALGIRVEAVETEDVSDRLGLVTFDVSVDEVDEDVTVLVFTVDVAFLRQGVD